MKNENDSNIVYLILIAGKKKEDELLDFLTQSGGTLVNVINGKGTVKSSYIKSIFGFVPEENKVVISCLITTEQSKKAIETLENKFGFDKHNTGIAFTVPVENI